MGRATKGKLLSVVVPAYKKADTIKRDLTSISKTLASGLPGDLDYEIICVVDGEVDDTAKIARSLNLPKLTVISYAQNKGKGYTVRQGMKRAKGDLISFLDAGMEISPKGIMMLLAHMDWYNADIVVGSKRHPVSMVNYPPLRRVLSVGYHFGIKLLFGVNIRDTQSGIKVFKRKVIDTILPKLLVKQYAMDIEMLAVANRLGFTRIYEAPIEVRFDEKTSTIDWEKVFRMAWDTMAVFYRLKILHYYD